AFRLARYAWVNGKFGADHSKADAAPATVIERRRVNRPLHPARVWEGDPPRRRHSPARKPGDRPCAQPEASRWAVRVVGRNGASASSSSSRLPFGTGECEEGDFM